MVSLSDVEQFADQLKAKFGKTTVAYTNVRMTQLSVARFYGGCEVNGHHFVYNPADDSLIREDVCKWIVKAKQKQTKQPKAPKSNEAQATLWQT